MSRTVFDLPHTEAILIERLRLVATVLRYANTTMRAATLLDVGCGVGNASRRITQDYGLRVTGVDLRAENVVEAKIRSTQEEYIAHDLERPCGPDCPLAGRTFDVTLCLGLLYHLENPFAAVRHIARHTGQILIVESRVSPGGTPHARLSQEGPGVDQSGAGLALVPSSSALCVMLASCGFKGLYEPTAYATKHKDFVLRHGWRERIVLVASRAPISAASGLGLVPRSSSATPVHAIWGK